MLITLVALLAVTLGCVIVQIIVSTIVAAHLKDLKCMTVTHIATVKQINVLLQKLIDQEVIK